MQQHREEAQTAAVHRRTKASAQLASVQATRQREQVVKALFQLFLQGLTDSHMYCMFHHHRNLV